MPTWTTQRTHRYYREADLLFFEFHGEFSLPDIQRLFEVVAPVQEEHGYALMAIDGRDSGSITPEARRYVGEKSRSHAAEGATAIIGASFAARTLIQLLRNAARLFGKHSNPLFFCATTDEAMAWLTSQRQRCRATRVEPKP